LLKFPFNNEKPELAIIIPPAILNAVIVIPKKDKTYCPTKKDIIKIIKTLLYVICGVLVMEVVMSFLKS
jgi:hypothetical protein